MNNIDQFELVEAYLSGDMSDEERIRFESNMAEDAALQEAYEEMLITRNVKGALVYASVKNRLAGTGTALIVPLYRKPVAQIAAVVAVLIISMVAYTNLQFTNSQIVSDYLALPNELLTRSAENGQGYVDALSAYSAGNYQEVAHIVESESFLPTYPLLAQKMYAISLLKINRTKEAIDIFTVLAANSKNVTRMREEFNLAVAYVQDGQVARAKEVLSSITAKPNHDYRNDASDLIDRINSPLRRLVF
ncbi:MAG: hypothetical protein OEQ53_05225 [Saprospiraceae bacterium]|nr:hypothetical protein [Saprospiraceae bacterium]